MLDFNSKATLIIPEPELVAMFEATVKGATQHAGDGASAARLLTRINLKAMPYMILGIPGQSYIIANLRQVAQIPPGQLIQMIHANKQPAANPNIPPLVNGI